MNYLTWISIALLVSALALHCTYKLELHRYGKTVNRRNKQLAQTTEELEKAIDKDVITVLSYRNVFYLKLLTECQQDRPVEYFAGTKALCVSFGAISFFLSFMI